LPNPDDSSDADDEDPEEKKVRMKKLIEYMTNMSQETRKLVLADYTLKKKNEKEIN
jgi:hypothetical protein